MRDNDLTELPEEIGQLDELTVLDVIGNRLHCLPSSITQLKLDALWVDGSQVCVRVQGPASYLATLCVCPYGVWSLVVL